MPRQRKNEYVVGQHFSWKLYMRDGVYWADGRSNPQSAGRHSLRTKSHDQALTNIRQLDLIKAVELGLADENILHDGDQDHLSLEDGVELYRAHVQRPPVTGGAGPATWKRYRAVFDKAIPFLHGKQVRYWNLVKKAHLESYAAWLDGEGYAYRTEFLELTTMKQAMNFLIAEGHLPASCRIILPLAKPKGSDTYCWRPEEVKAILEHCREHSPLQWLGDVLTALACTGMRMSELAALRWSDMDLDDGHITLKDETSSPRRDKNQPLRQTKSRRSRSFPIHDELAKVLRRMPRAGDGRVYHGPKGGVLSPDIARRTLIREVLTPLAEKFPTPEGEGGWLPSWPAPFLPPLLLFHVRQPQRPRADADGMAGPRGEQDGAALLPRPRRRIPTADAEVGSNWWGRRRVDVPKMNSILMRRPRRAKT